MAKPDGGPAFARAGSPIPRYDDGFEGMSLRDYFAAQALPEAIAHERSLRQSQISPGVFRYAEIAQAAYVIADAMLAEREKD